MNPAPAMLADYVTPAFMWACVAAASLGILTAKIIRAWNRAKQATTPQALARIIDGHEAVYDQEMHQEGDLAKWEKEINS